MTARQPPARLRAARRHLLHIERCRLINDLQWHPQKQHWWIEFELAHAARQPHLPNRTRWCLIIEEPFPYGDLHIQPSKDGGLSATFPHQAVNDYGEAGVPWRNGALCATHPTQAFGRFGELPLPRLTERRLCWMVLRTLDWLDHAAHGELLMEGQPFELPSYGHASRLPKLQVIVREDATSFHDWTQDRPRAGIVDTIVCDRGPRRVIVVVAFRDSAGRVIWRLPDMALRNIRGQTFIRGVWTRLEKPLLLAPWQAPRTWGELVAAATEGGDDLHANLRDIHPEHLGPGKRIMLLGAPVPDVVGGPPVEMAWQAVTIPTEMVPAPSGRQPSNPTLAHSLSQTRFEGRALRWLQVANWSAARLGARGRLDDMVRDCSVVLLGAGALGCLVAEFLVRGGVHNLTIVDGDRLEAGNLVRHTLGTEDLHESKALQLVNRLTGASPHARIKGIHDNVPSAQTQAAIAVATVVIDCTAEDDVLQALGDREQTETKRWISAAVGAEARSLFIFMAKGHRFPAEEFFAHMDRRSDKNEINKMRWEGPGCWSPVFPARMDQMALMAAVVAERVQVLMKRALDDASFEVFLRRSSSDGTFDRLERERKVRAPRANLGRPKATSSSRRARVGRWVADRLLAWSDRLEA